MPTITETSGTPLNIFADSGVVYSAEVNRGSLSSQEADQLATV